MIEIKDVQKSFWIKGGKKVVANGINAVFPTGRSVALLGRNGAGKSTLLQMIAGTISPDSGTITTTGTISWPVGFAGSFHRDLSGSQNTKFIARVYGVDTDELLDFVQDFAELGRHFYEPVKSYSAGMRSRLAFGLSMGIRFDTYLVDEVTSVGDADFKTRSRILFEDRIRNSGAVVVSHSMRKVKKMCDSAAVFENGKVTYFEDVNDGIAAYTASQGALDDDDD